uniref:CRAL-TRIO domain-containing protein n=2 Tax=Clastoptera arizonana TaxID=38151 RepID=A0A1B6DAX9_9HEMI
MTTSINMWGVTLEEEYEKNPELKQEFIQEIREWLNSQKHLPEIEDLEIVMFLKACEWDMNETKQTMEAFYTHRTNLPEIFSGRDPSSKEIQEIAQVVHVTALPQADPEGNRIIWGRLLDTDSSRYSFISVAKYFVMTSEVLQLKQGTIPGMVLVYDVKHLTLSHLMKSPMSVMTRYANYAQEGASFPVKAIHYVNTNTVLDKLIHLVRPILRSRLINVLHLHSNPETLFKHIPKNIVPKDYGGDERSLEELNDLNMENLQLFREWFLEEEKVKRVDESKRPNKKKADKTESKLLPTFKKLELD